MHESIRFEYTGVFFFFAEESLFLIILSHFYLFSLILVSGSWKKKRKISIWNLTFSRLCWEAGSEIFFLET